MRVVLFGATGMIGKAALLECLDEPPSRWARVKGEAERDLLALPALRSLIPSQVTDSVRLGKALIRVACDGHELIYVENADINLIGA